MPDEQPDHPEHHPVREAAEGIDDPGRLLHGEDPETHYLDDARHWQSVYGELLDFKHMVIATTRQRIETASSGVREELLGTDIPLLEGEANRLRARREFWDRRVAELGG